jgi:hypothetical protein
MVSMPTIRPMICLFRPGQGDGFLRAIKICSKQSFGREEKHSTPCRKILLHIKITSKYGQRYFEGQSYHFLCQVPPDLVVDDCACRIATELCWTNQEFLLSI